MNASFTPDVIAGSPGQSADPAALPPISAPYLLAVNIPIVRDIAGAYWASPLWQRDIAQHTRYLADFRLACPVRRGEPPAEWVRVEVDPSVPTHRLQVIDLPDPRSLPHALLALPATKLRIWSAIGAAEVVHCGVAGWPLPLGWVAAPMARLRRRRLIVLVESAPWRPAGEGGGRRPLKARLRQWFYEPLARLCVRWADLAVFTHEQYRQSLLGQRNVRSSVIPASWIDDENIIAPEHLAQREAERRDGAPLRLMFAGRLVAEKGVNVLLEAVERLQQRGVAVQVDFYGVGPLAETIERMSQRAGPCQVAFRGTLPYDHRFFGALAAADAVLVPSLSDEQPRIVFDAYAQAAPVIGSRTAGLAEVITDGGTGVLVEPGSAAALADKLAELAADRAQLRRLGRQGLEQALQFTHRVMHRRRHELILQLLEP